MQGFEAVTLSWRGQSYTVPANQQMMLIAKLEDALSGESGKSAIEVLFRNGGPPHTALARAFGAALRYAGADVSDDEVYLSIHEDIAASSTKQAFTKLAGMIVTLLAVISPPTFRVSNEAAIKAESAKKPRAAALSKRSTASLSGKDG